MKMAKVRYYSKLLDENVSNPRKYWEVINKEEITEIEGKMYDVHGFGGKIADEFNRYF